MKSRFLYINAHINDLFSNSKIFLVTLILIVANVYGVFSCSLETLYIDRIIETISNRYYLCIILFAILICVYNVFDKFKKNTFLILRLKNKKNCIIKLIKDILYNVTIILFINFCILLILSNLTWSGNLGLHNYQNYNITNIIYLSFYFFRLLILIYLLSIFFSFINIIFGFMLSFLINSFIISLNIIADFYMLKIPIFYTYYLGDFSFDSFMDELLYSSIYLCCFYILILLIKKIIVFFYKNVIM